MAQDSFVLGAVNTDKKEKKNNLKTLKISAWETMNKCNWLGSQRQREEKHLIRRMRCCLNLDSELL